MTSIKNKIKFFENQNKQQQTISKHNNVNTNNVKKNVSHWNKIRQDVLNKPYISQTTYAFGRNQTTKILIQSTNESKEINVTVNTQHNIEIIEENISDNEDDNWINSIIN